MSRTTLREEIVAVLKLCLLYKTQRMIKVTDDLTQKQLQTKFKKKWIYKKKKEKDQQVWLSDNHKFGNFNSSNGTAIWDQV